MSSDTHSKLIGYLLWIFGFTGSHRFYFGRPVTGTIWFFTLGLLGVGWLIDVFLIPWMERTAEARYARDRSATTSPGSCSPFSASSASTASTWASGSPASCTW